MVENRAQSRLESRVSAPPHAFAEMIHTGIFRSLRTHEQLNNAHLTNQRTISYHRGTWQLVSIGEK